MSSISNAVRLAKARAVPIIGISTPDQFDTRSEILSGIETLSEQLGDWPALDWDIAQGVLQVRGKNTPPCLTDQELVKACRDPSSLLCMLAPELRDRGVLILRGAHHLLEDPVCVQAMLNLRDTFKERNSTLVLLAPCLKLPLEMANDVLLIDQPLPSRQEISGVVDSVAADEKVVLDDKARSCVIDAVQGLTRFGAEQVLNLGLLKTGGPPRFDIELLWARKKAFIRQTRGLSISDAKHTYEDIGGLEWLKKYFRNRVLTRKNRPKVVCFIDEIEKALAGLKGDNTGVTQDQLQEMLKHMQKHKALGAVFVGAPGASKSYFAEATGNEAKVPTVVMDFGGMKGEHVGESEQAVRHGLKLLNAIADSDQLFIATCNSLGDMPPELLRRFRLGIFYFKMPTKEERDSIWKVKLAQYKWPVDSGLARDADMDEGWTGAQIEHCVDTAWQTGISLEEAAEDIVPFAITGQSQLKALEELAERQGFKDATTGKRYSRPKQTARGRKTLEV